MLDFIKRNKLLIGLSVFAVAVLYVFFPVLGKYTALHAPDSMPFFAYKYRAVTWANLLGGQTSFTPHTLYWLIFNPLYAHELTYIIDTLFLALGGFYYLRGRGVSPIAAWCGALALGFSGYTFTLFCAGHRGYFHMISAVIWSFGLLDRGFRTKKLFYFAMLGLVFAWGIAYQPDVFILVGAVAAFYALWLSFVAGDGIKNSVLKIWPRFLIMVVFLGVAGYGGIYKAATTRIADRKAQISGQKVSDKTESEAVQKSEAEVAKEKKEQWFFATNWSLPPEDMLEFIVPGVFGNESIHGSNPYWGRLGQPHKNVFQKGRMMPNYRQHTVYMGVIPVIFALFAVLVWLRIRRKPDDEDDLTERDVYRDVPFWIGVWVLCLILAMGRFTPLYRLFYAIPYMDLIRAPVKFLHIVEVASAILCGYGVYALLAKEEMFSKIKKQFLWVAGAVAGLLVLTALIFMAGQSTIIEHVKALGMVQFADGTSAYALKNIGRSLMLVVPVAAIGFILCKKNNKLLFVVFGYAVMALLVFDQASVARRYVKVMNLEPFYKENCVVKALKKDSDGGVPRVLNYAPHTQGEWFRKSLSYNGIMSLEPTQSQAGKPYAKLFSSLQKNPQRLWQVLNAKYLIVPYSTAGQLVRSGVVKPVLNLEIGAGVVRQPAQPGEKTFALLALNGVDSNPRLLTRWQGGVAVEDQVQQVVDSKLVVSDAVQSVNPTDHLNAEVKVLFEQSIPAAYSIGVKTSASSESLLIFNQRVSAKYEVLVDDQRTDSCVADGVWMAVKVLEGNHEVVLRHKRKPLTFILSLISMFVIAIWGALRILKKVKSREHSEL